MTSVVIATAVLFLGGLLRTVVTSLLAGEISSTLAAYLRRRVHKAAATLPAELADDQEAEWLDELAVLNDRPLRAVLFTRGLSKAARTMAPGLQCPTLSRSSQRLKRVVDLVGSTVAIWVALPALIVVYVAIRLDSRGPAFIRQHRIGKDGQSFPMLKFRTMVAHAEPRKAGLMDGTEALDLFKFADDPRITRVGRLLRRTSLEELPQLLNILRGEMSLVGPPPLLPEVASHVSGPDRSPLTLTPGMTGPWQLPDAARMPLQEKVKLDDSYVASWSLWGDVKILLRTMKYVLERPPG